MYQFFSLLSLSVIILFSSCCREDEPLTNGFGDTFPVTFIYDTITEMSESRIYLADGRDLPFALEERENEMNSNLYVARNQVKYIKLLNLNDAELQGAHKDGVTISTYDVKYNNTGDEFKFSLNILIETLEYEAHRTGDTLKMKGLTCLRYNNGQRQSRSTTVEVTNYTLQDEKNKVTGNDTLYYRTFNIKLVKQK